MTSQPHSESIPSVRLGLAVALAALALRPIVIPSLLALGLAVVSDAAAGGRIPDGVYRATVTVKSLRAAGVDPQNARWNSGVQTMIFRGQRWTNTMVRGAYHAPPCSGDLSYANGRVILTADRGRQCGTASGGLLFSARWSFAGGELRFSGVKAQPDDPVPLPVFDGRPWKKVG